MPKRRGFAPIIVILVVVVLAAAAGGYFFFSKGGSLSSIPGVPGGVALNPNCKFNEPDLCKFINNFKLTNNYSAKSTFSDKSGKKSGSTFESVGDNKTHMATSTDGKEDYNVITIADTTYTKDYSDNKWWKQKQPKVSPSPGSQASTNIKDEVAKTDQPEDKTTYKKIGMEACDLRQCFKYQVIDPANTDTTEYIWFDNKEYLLRKERSEGKDGTVSETTISYDKVNISEPTPTKDAAPDQVIVPTGTGTGMTQQEIKDLQNSSVKTQEQAPPAETPPPADTPTDENQP